MFGIEGRSVLYDWVARLCSRKGEKNVLLSAFLTNWSIEWHSKKGEKSVSSAAFMPIWKSGSYWPSQRHGFILSDCTLDFEPIIVLAYSCLISLMLGGSLEFLGLYIGNGPLSIAFNSFPIYKMNGWTLADFILTGIQFYVFLFFRRFNEYILWIINRAAQYLFTLFMIFGVFGCMLSGIHSLLTWQ